MASWFNIYLTVKRDLSFLQKAEIGPKKDQDVMVFST